MKNYARFAQVLFAIAAIITFRTTQASADSVFQVGDKVMDCGMDILNVVDKTTVDCADNGHLVNDVIKVEGSQVTIKCSNGCAEAYSTDSNNLIREIIEFNQIKKGDWVILTMDQSGHASSNSVGKIEHMFENGYVQLAEQMYQDEIIGSGPVSEIAQIGEITKNSIVLLNTNRVGAVQHIFQDGRVQIFDERAPNTDNYIVGRNPQIEVPEIGNLKPYNYGIDGQNRVGIISHVFADGRAEYSLLDTSGCDLGSTPMPYFVDTLSPEVEAASIDTSIRHGKFVTVSPSSKVLPGHTGWIEKVFQNQKVLFKYIIGDYHFAVLDAADIESSASN